MIEAASRLGSRCARWCIFAQWRDVYSFFLEDEWRFEGVRILPKPSWGHWSNCPSSGGGGVCVWVSQGSKAVSNPFRFWEQKKVLSVICFPRVQNCMKNSFSVFPFTYVETNRWPVSGILPVSHGRFERLTVAFIGVLLFHVRIDTVK